MMNAGLKRASISATLIFADLRQVTNEIEEAHQYSIHADAIQQDRCFLLSSYGSTSLANPIALDVEDADVEKHTKTTADKCCALSGATREPAVFISSKSSLPFFGPLAAPSE